MMMRSDFALYTIAIALVYVGADWTDCPDKCKCVWSNGKKTAECESANFTEIPSSFSRELQVLNLNRNKLRRLPEKAFYNAGIYNLHKIYLKECGIEVIHKNALSELRVLIELDLSHNRIHSLHKDLFRDCNRIREIRMTNNPIQTLEDGLFNNLTFLQIVDFSYCKLHHIGLDTFTNIPSLSRLELKGNNFSYLPLESVSRLTGLKTLGLEHNPWNCDCHLRPLRNWVTERNLYSIPTNCEGPHHLAGKQWSEIGDEDSFACKPKIISVARESSKTLTCIAEGDPVPTLQWTHNNVILTNQSFDYVIHESVIDKKRVSNLTFRGPRGRDNREYFCTARNFAGRVDGRYHLNLDDSTGGDLYYGSEGDSYDTWLLLAGCLIGASLLALVVVFVKCYVCKRRNSAIASKKDKENANGSVSQMIESEEKSLINVINPVQKPPRRQEASLNNSDAELHDSTVSQYNGDGSVLGSIPAESKEHSIGSSATLPRGRSTLDGFDPVTDRCPPDLLSFPIKSDQGSPADGATPYLSTTDRSPFSRTQRLNPQYGGQFGTLPYSRSHSPFSPPLAVVPCQSGYVTIPRKPRTPSWSASLSPVLVSPDEKYKSEPVYDNLGPRTTADGSSILNLPKCDLGIPMSYKNRPLPQTPTDSKRYCEPIKELDSYSPILKSSRTPNSLLRSNPTTEKVKRDLSTPEPKRQSWARMTPDGTHVHSTDETESLISPRGILPGVTPAKKIPPNPPPKPKKKTGRNPFYEEEREVDGTEV